MHCTEETPCAALVGLAVPFALNRIARHSLTLCPHFLAHRSQALLRFAILHDRSLHVTLQRNGGKAPRPWSPLGLRQAR